MKRDRLKRREGKSGKRTKRREEEHERRGWRNYGKQRRKRKDLDHLNQTRRDIKRYKGNVSEKKRNAKKPAKKRKLATPQGG